MANDNLFFKKLAEVHPRFGTPAAAIISLGIWSAILACAGKFAELIGGVIFIGWIFYGLGAAAIFPLRRESPDARLSLSRPRLPLDVLSLRSRRRSHRRQRHHPRLPRPRLVSAHRRRHHPLSPRPSRVLLLAPPLRTLISAVLITPCSETFHTGVVSNAQAPHAFRCHAFRWIASHLLRREGSCSKLPRSQSPTAPSPPFTM